MKKLAFVSLFLGLSCAALAAEVQGPYDWSGVRIMQYDRFYISGPFSAESLEGAKAAGVQTVINIREPQEITVDERAIVEGAGFTYYHIPVSRQGAFQPEAFEAINDAAAEGKIWINCASGNRAAGWFATYLVIKQGYSLEDALAIGNQVGITNDAIRQKVRDYVAQHGN
ncbi:MAG: sulfur transferase domain-containing protein [Oligoflexales bacterium]